VSGLHGGTVLSRLVELFFVCSSNFMEAEWLGLCYNLVLYEEKMKIYPLQTTEAIWYLTQPDPPISTRESRAHTEGGGRGSRTHIYIYMYIYMYISVCGHSDRMHSIASQTFKTSEICCFRPNQLCM